MSHGSIDDILARIARLEQGSGEKPAPRSSEPEPEPKGDQEAARDPAGFQTIEPDEAVNDSAEDDAEILSSDTFRDDADLDHDEDAEFESSAEQDRDAVFGTITPDADLDEPEPSAPKHPESGLHAPVFKIGKQGFEEMNLARPMARKGSVERADASVNEQDAEPEQAATEQKNKPEPAKKPSSGSDGVVSVGTGFASAKGMSDLFVPDNKVLGHVNKSLGDVLAERGTASKEMILSAEKVMSQTPGKSLGEILIEQGVDEASVQAAVAEHQGLGFERVDLEKGFEGGFDGKMLQRLGVPYCAEKKVLPLRMEGSRVVIAATRPDAAFELDEIKQRLGCSTPKLVLTTSMDIKAALEVAGAGEHEKHDQEVDLNDILEDVDEMDVEVEKAADQTVDLEQQAGESPVIRYVNYIIQTAVREGASDIHIEPQEKKLKVRLRVDGVLFEAMNPPASMAAAITSRIKIMANLDISERRIPQDGRIRCTVQGRKLDLRVSTLPAAVGEKIVMRILDTKSINVKLEDLGFEESTLEIWRNQVKQAHGIVLVTGPTGSGKTTTLYSSIRQLDKNKLNISTCEDPIEYHLDGITQTQTHEKIGMTFSRVLRALLRQDPDVIMVGEIRDQETARIAIQSALTGHLVLSTLHTNDAPSAVTRLVDMGIEPYLITSTVRAVLAQRLVRVICPACKTAYQPSAQEIKDFGFEKKNLKGGKLFRGSGCEECVGTGYRGRAGIYSMMVLDHSVQRSVLRGDDAEQIAQAARESKAHPMMSLYDYGLRKVVEGVTTIEEVVRVT
ncbi:MAG: type II/IV secretion system protein [Phycisphaerales bacterium]|nr:type II/IV secretion system protein [Phycisphaerales bacterium]